MTKTTGRNGDPDEATLGQGLLGGGMEGSKANNPNLPERPCIYVPLVQTSGTISVIHQLDAQKMHPVNKGKDSVARFEVQSHGIFYDWETD